MRYLSHISQIYPQMSLKTLGVSCVLAISSLICVFPAHAGYKEALAAWDKKDYQGAYEAFKPMAENGDSASQYYMAKILELNGQTQAALPWYKAAALQGKLEAQSRLGVLYGEGKLVATNYLESYKWLALAASSGNTQAIEFLELLKAQMTPEEIELGQNLLTDILAQLK